MAPPVSRVHALSNGSRTVDLRCTGGVGGGDVKVIVSGCIAAIPERARSQMWIGFQKCAIDHGLHISLKVKRPDLIAAGQIARTEVNAALFGGLVDEKTILSDTNGAAGEAIVCADL